MRGGRKIYCGSNHWEQVEDGDLNKIIGESRGVGELHLSIDLNYIGNKNITWRGVELLTRYRWENLTTLNLGNP